MNRQTTSIHQSSRAPKQELLILCARIGYNP